MKPCLRVSLVLVILLQVPVGLQAQNLEASSTGTKDQSASVIKKPKRRPDQMITNDPVALLAVRRAPPVMVAPSVESSKKEPAGAGLDELSKKPTDIASLEQQIKDRQNRITLLMRLFVNDEKAFLMDPSNTKVDAVVAERRRYEQDELRWETAELAKLEARLEELPGKRGAQQR